MKLVYYDKIKFLDANMSDSQVGARKNKSIKNYTWMLNSVINEV